MNIEISNICNFQCSFCPPVERNKKMMSIDLFEKAIQQVAPLTDLVCFHLMGDPLVHPHLEELVLICEKHNVKIFFVTNGYLLKPQHNELLSKKIFHQINFSLHSFFDNYPEKDSTLYLNKIFQFTDRAMEVNPDLYINYRLWNLADIYGKNTDNLSMLRSIESKYNFKFNPDIDVTKQKSYHIKNRLYLHFDTQFIWPSLTLPTLGEKGTCYGLTSHFGIHADGTVVPCCLDKEANISLGNLVEHDIETILNSDKAKRIYNGFKQNKLVETLCQKCQYITRFQ